MGNLQPLHKAVSELDESAIAALLDGGNAIDELSGRGVKEHTPIEYVFDTHNEMILAECPNPDSWRTDGTAESMAKRHRVLRLLLERGADINLLLTRISSIDHGQLGSPLPISQFGLAMELGATREAFVTGIRTTIIQFHHHISLFRPLWWRSADSEFPLSLRVSLWAFGGKMVASFAEMLRVTGPKHKGETAACGMYIAPSDVRRFLEMTPDAVGAEVGAYCHSRLQHLAGGVPIPWEAFDELCDEVQEAQEILMFELTTLRHPLQDRSGTNQTKGPFPYGVKSKIVTGMGLLPLHLRPRPFWTFHGAEVIPASFLKPHPLGWSAAGLLKALRDAPPQTGQVAETKQQVLQIQLQSPVSEEWARITEPSGALTAEVQPRTVVMLPSDRLIKERVRLQATLSVLGAGFHLVAQTFPKVRELSDVCRTHGVQESELAASTELSTDEHGLELLCGGAQLRAWPLENEIHEFFGALQHLVLQEWWDFDPGCLAGLFDPASFAGHPELEHLVDHFDELDAWLSLVPFSRWRSKHALDMIHVFFGLVTGRHEFIIDRVGQKLQSTHSCAVGPVVGPVRHFELLTRCQWDLNVHLRLLLLEWRVMRALQDGGRATPKHACLNVIGGLFESILRFTFKDHYYRLK